MISVPPMVWIPTKVAPARLGKSLTLECRSEAYPKAVNYWTKGNGDIIANGKYRPQNMDCFILSTYKVSE